MNAYFSLVLGDVVFSDNGHRHNHLTRHLGRNQLAEALRAVRLVAQSVERELEQPFCVLSSVLLTAGGQDHTVPPTACHPR